MPFPNMLDGEAIPRNCPFFIGNDLLCAVDTETTGLDPEKNEIFQLCVIPLNVSFETCDIRYPIFNLYMRPTRFEFISPAAMSAVRKQVAELSNLSLDPVTGADMFGRWFENLNMPPGGRLQVIAHNWPFDRMFISKWLGEAAANDYFSAFYRDTLSMAVQEKDLRSLGGKPGPYESLTLEALASRYGVKDNLLPMHNAMTDALTTARLYRVMLQHRSAEIGIESPSGPQPPQKSDGG